MSFTITKRGKLLISVQVSPMGNLKSGQVPRKTRGCHTIDFLRFGFPFDLDGEDGETILAPWAVTSVPIISHNYFLFSFFFLAGCGRFHFRIDMS